MRWSGNAAAAYAGPDPGAGDVADGDCWDCHGPSVIRRLITRIVWRPFAAGSAGGGLLCHWVRHGDPLPEGRRTAPSIQSSAGGGWIPAFAGMTRPK